MLVVAANHYGTEPLASFYADPIKAHKALFYIAQGLKGVVLWAVVWWLLAKFKKLTACGATVCMWGILEDGQVAVCRMALGIESYPIASPGKGLCSLVTGHPTFLFGVIVAILVAAIVDFGSKTK